MIQERSISLSLIERAEDGEGHSYLFRISDESLDSHNTVFEIKGLRNKSASVPITFGHPSMNTTDPADVIGRREVIVKEDGVYAKAVFASAHNERAKMVEGMVRDGFLEKASIRAFVYNGYEVNKEDGEAYLRFSDWELKDWGVVMHPSNGNAQVVDIREVMRALNIEENEDENPEPTKKVEKALLDRAANIINT